MNLDLPTWTDTEQTADILPIEGCTASHNISLMFKHLASIGCLDVLTQMKSLSSGGFDGANHLDICCVTSDGGGDISCARRLSCVWTSETDLVLWFDNGCLEHCAHLGVRDQLKQADRWFLAKSGQKYFSTMAKVTHLQRDNRKLFYQEFGQQFCSHSKTRSP